MDLQHLQNAGHGIVSGNQNDFVVAASIDWNSDSKHLELVYYLDHLPSEDDVELCELAMTELLAEFPDIRTSSTKLVTASAPLNLNTVPGLVYARPA